jgi:hypothetical protein
MNNRPSMARTSFFTVSSLMALANLRTRSAFSVRLHSRLKPLPCRPYASKPPVKMIAQIVWIENRHFPRRCVYNRTHAQGYHQVVQGMRGSHMPR